MKNEQLIEAKLRDYLLGDLSESEEKQFEEQLMDNDQLFSHVGSLMDLVEDELVEDYLQDALDDSGRRSFELRLLGSPRIREKVTLAKALLKRAKLTEPKPVPEPSDNPIVHWLKTWIGPIMQPVPALAASLFVLLIGGGYWSTVKIVGLEDQLNQASSQQALLVEAQESLESQLSDERRRTDRVVSELESANARSTSLERALEALRDRLVSPIVSVFLKPGLYRGSGDIGALAVSREHQLAELRLDLGIDEYPTYRAALCNAAGDEITVQNRLNAVHEGEQVLVVPQFPASFLSPGNYHVKLSGVTRAGEVEQLDLYHFRVLAE
ncbi:MAG TPA: hypothetical protein VMY18_11320 [Acidobacteriota bacterium]|nr:hypothetical protein [Acidobacteriota bacterium]